MSEYKTMQKETGSKSKSDADDSGDWTDWMFGRGALKEAAKRGGAQKDKVTKLGNMDYMKGRIAETMKDKKEKAASAIKKGKKVLGSAKKKDKDSYDRED